MECNLKGMELLSIETLQEQQEIEDQLSTLHLNLYDNY